MVDAKNSKSIHWALTPSANIILPLVFGCSAFSFIRFIAPINWLLPLLAAILGTISGRLQIGVIKEYPEEISKSSSMNELQKIWRTTKLGKRSFIFRQIAQVLYGSLTIWVGLAQGKGNANVDLPIKLFFNFLTCDFIFMAVRELVTLKASFELEKIIEKNNG